MIGADTNIGMDDVQGVGVEIAGDLEVEIEVNQEEIEIEVDQEVKIEGIRIEVGKIGEDIEIKEEIIEIEKIIVKYFFKKEYFFNFFYIYIIL